MVRFDVADKRLLETLEAQQGTPNVRTSQVGELARQMPPSRLAAAVHIASESCLVGPGKGHQFGLPLAKRADAAKHT
jgi:hypothetical protein